MSDAGERERWGRASAQLDELLGYTAAPNLMRGPSFCTVVATTFRTVCHLLSSVMLPDRSSTK